ncbi:MAG TPA: hypothetical protein VNU47_01550 [Candidatus Paceibacterota bacterium]|nr:hypothetical protein [Candidatus Paceibacterota bacterium]
MFRTLAAITLTLLVGYGLIKATPLFLGPDIQIDAPLDGAAIEDGFMTISGTATHTRTLTLNGAPFLIDENGRFETTLLLPKGGAILSLTATDRFGRQTSVERTVFIP